MAWKQPLLVGTSSGMVQGTFPAVVSHSRDTPWPGYSQLTWHSQDRRGDVGFLVDLDVVLEPVDLHRLWRSHSLARQVEGAVPGDIQLLGLTDEVWETCMDTRKQKIPHFWLPAPGHSARTQLHSCSSSPSSCTRMGSDTTSTPEMLSLQT